MVIIRLFFLLLFLPSATAGQAGEELVVTVDRNFVKEGETLVLSVRWTGAQATGQPDFSLLQQDFELLGRPQGTNHQSYSLVNGRQTVVSYREYKLTLAPRRPGRLLIPPLTLGGRSSRPIAVTVSPLSAGERQARNQAVFFITEVDAEEIHVQSQLRYTVKLFYVAEEPNATRSNRLRVSGDFPPEPKLEDAVVEPFGGEKRYQANRGQQRYSVLEKQYLIFPQSSGELRLPPEVFSGQVRRGRNAPRRIRTSSGGHSIRVKPKPAAYPADAVWLPARRLSLTETFDVTPPEFAVGEPVNRTLRLSAEGILGSALPELPALDLPQARTYADPPEIDEQQLATGIRASRVETTGIVPIGGAQLLLPEVRIHWWDTEADELRVASLPARQFPVAGAAAVRQAPAPETAPAPVIARPTTTAPGGTRLPAWLLASHLLLAGGWLATFIQYRRSHRDAPGTKTAREPANPEQAAFRSLAEATATPEQFRARLIHWSRLHWRRHHASLADLARTCRDPELTRLLKNLDESVHGRYRPEPARAPTPDCLRILQKLREVTDATRTRKHGGLAPLNPV